MKKRVFSGVQPTGQIHLGNYVTMRNFVTQQADKDCFYCIVDLHAITVPQDPDQLRQTTLELAALYLAIGIDPEKSTLFVQSHVAAHAELAWYLQCYTYMGELSRMTQFKDKSKKQESVSTGLYTYPVLMAADILLYDTHYVPVGNDQKQHLELTRDVAERFNNRYGETFVIPEPLIAKQGARIMAFDEPENKMSKSDENPHAKILLLDSPNKIKKTIMKATTDSDMSVHYDPKNKSGISNLMTIYAEFTGTSFEEIEKTYAGQGYGQFKKDLVTIIQDELAPIQKRYHEILESGEVERILKAGAERAQAVSAEVLARTKEKIGFYIG